MAIAILMPSVGPAAQSGRLTRWLRRVGDFVEAGDPVAEIATAHATMDVEAPRTGVLTRILVAEGEDGIAVDAEIAVIEPGPAPHVPQIAGGEVEGGDRAARIRISPRARRHAHEAGCDLSRISGSGPNGRIVEADVRAAIELRARGAETRRASRPTGRLHPLMEQAQWTPQVHLEADCRLDALEAFRASLNESARTERRVRISLLDCVVKALAIALLKAPRANVALSAEGYELARHADVALALTLDDEIVAPALTEAETMSLAEIAAARAAFLAGRFAPNAFIGGASLVANLGAFGVRRFLPTVVAPWTSVLGIGAAEKRVIVEQGAPVVATMLGVTLAIDRRAMDEAAGGALIAAFKGLLEHPEGLVD
jgi:pyruvate dehydrogenase E2 component (dihydrolipoamide acetyltransferase)